MVKERDARLGALHSNLPAHLARLKRGVQLAVEGSALRLYGGKGCMAVDDLKTQTALETRVPLCMICFDPPPGHGAK